MVKEWPVVMIRRGAPHVVPGRMMRRIRKQLALSQEWAPSTNYHLLLSLNLVDL